MMIFEGHNVWGSAIEDILSQHSSINQVAVVGIVKDESINSEIPTAFVALNESEKSHKKTF